MIKMKLNLKTSDNRKQIEIKNYQFLTGDINFKEYGGQWYRCTGDKEYYVIESVNMENATGDISNGKYLFTVYSIDMDNLTEKEIKDALSCHGCEDEEGLNELIIMEACVSYGHADIITNEYSNNFWKTFKELKREY